MDPYLDVNIAFSPEQLRVLNICLAFLMLSVAIDLTWEDFRRLFKQPRPVAIGLSSQLLLLPLITFGLIQIFDPVQSLAIGMILVAACPGGNVSNYAVHLAKGNTALSITMTSIVTLLSAFLTPFLFFFWADIALDYTGSVDLKIDLWPMVRLIGTLIFIPLLIGMLLKRHQPSFVDTIRKPLRFLSMAVFLLFILGALWSKRAFLNDYLDDVFFLVLVHNALALAGGFIWAKSFKLPLKDVKAISIETGIQNSGLALVIIFNFFNGMGGMALIAAWWGIWHLISGFLTAMIFSRFK